MDYEVEEFYYLLIIRVNLKVWNNDKNINNLVSN